MFVLDTTGTVDGMEDSFAKEQFDSKDFLKENVKNKKKSETVNMSMVLTFSGAPEASTESEKKR